MRNGGHVITPRAYAPAHEPWRVTLAPGDTAARTWPLKPTAGWYDLAVETDGDETYLRRFAGHVETGRASLSDPAMGGPARMVRG